MPATDLIDVLRPIEGHKYYLHGSEDALQAEWLAAVFAQGIRYDHTTRQWHIWDKDSGIWRPDKVEEVGRMVTKAAKIRVNDLSKEYADFIADDNAGSPKAKATLALLKVYRGLLNVAKCESVLTKLAEHPSYKTNGDDWDTEPHLLGCQNGVVDLRRNEMIEPSPESLVTRSTGHDFKPIGDLSEARDRAPRFMQFLDEITSGDMPLQMFYLLWFGYSLFGHTQEQRFLILTGLGRNGKGALTNVMGRVFGDYTASVDASLYMKTRFGAARSDGARADLIALKGRRLAVMSEPHGGQFNEEMLKAHTGGDPITARALYSNNLLTWEPTHSITFLTNEPPSVSDIGPAMTARVMVADFRERFDGEREDKQLYTKLFAEAEGILAILCWAAKLWYESPHGLEIPKRVIDASAEYVSANDQVGRALDEAFVIERGAQSTGKQLFDAYTDWYDDNIGEGGRLTMVLWSSALKRRGFVKKHTMKGAIYTGIRPKKTSDY